MKQIQIETHIHLSLILMLKNHFSFFFLFSNRIKIPYKQLLIFLSFIMAL